MTSSSHPQRQRQDMMKKQVSFSSSLMEVYHPVSRHENPEDLWFTRLDELTFKQRDANIMKTLLKHLSPIDLENQLLQNNEESCRGLEYAKSDTIRQIQLRKRSTKIAVLNMQSKCFAIGQKDPSTSISRAYSMISKSAIQHAIQIALNDEKYVDNHIRRRCEETMEEKNMYFTPSNNKQPSSSSSSVVGGRTTTITMTQQLRCPRSSPTTTTTFHQRTARTA